MRRNVVQGGDAKREEGQKRGVTVNREGLSAIPLFGSLSRKRRIPSVIWKIQLPKREKHQYLGTSTPPPLILIPDPSPAILSMHSCDAATLPILSLSLVPTYFVVLFFFFFNCIYSLCARFRKILSFLQIGKKKVEQITTGSFFFFIYIQGSLFLLDIFFFFVLFKMYYILL